MKCVKVIRSAIYSLAFVFPVSVTSTDLFVWGASAELPESVILILMAQGVTSVSQLRQLSDQDVDTFFQIPGLLLRTQCTSLKAAIRRLSASSEASSYNCRWGLI